MKKKTYEISFRTYYANGNTCDHRQEMKLADIGKWIEAYLFTHPEVKSITIKMWNE